MNTETNTAAQAAETLLAEAVGFANISQRFAFQTDTIESAFVPVGEAAMIRVTTEDPEHAVLSLLDASGVERIGQSGLQLLLSAARTASENGFDFKLSEPSEALSETLALTGLSATLMG